MAAPHSALVAAVVRARDGNYTNTGTAMKNLVESANVLSFAQIRSVLMAHMDDTVKINQLRGGYGKDVWQAKHGQAIIRAFLEKYVLESAFVIPATESAEEVQELNRALSVAFDTAAFYTD